MLYKLSNKINTDKKLKLFYLRLFKPNFTLLFTVEEKAVTYDRFKTDGYFSNAAGLRRRRSRRRCIDRSCSSFGGSSIFRKATNPRPAPKAESGMTHYARGRSPTVCAVCASSREKRNRRRLEKLRRFLAVIYLLFGPLQCIVGSLKSMNFLHVLENTQRP